jgi:hypothetical protein
MFGEMRAQFGQWTPWYNEWSLFFRIVTVFMKRNFAQLAVDNSGKIAT